MTGQTGGLEPLFRPRTIAIIGASTDPASIGHRTFKNILEGGYTGIVHPVHPKARAVLGVRAYRSVLDVPDDVDLAVVIVPAKAVLEVVRQCAEKGVKGLVMLSAGFRETGPEGAEREEALGALVRSSGMRMVGPNCLGIINTSPDVRLNATFAPRAPPFGRTAMMSQSGALGVAVLEHAADLGLGLSRFVSLGNKTDVSGNDLLEAWADDPEVDLVLLYLENFGNPRNFVRIARRMARDKPIIAVKSGRGRAGQRAAESHTGALAEPDLTVDALLEQCGVLRAGTIEELFDIAVATSLQPLPPGDRVAVVTNSGGPAIMAVDALENRGFTIASFEEPTVERMRRVAPPEASLSDPVDLLGGAGPEAYQEVLEAVLDDPGVDAVVTIYTPTVAADEARVAGAIVTAARTAADKPVLSVTMGRGTSAPAFARLMEGGVPAYSYPENAVRALDAMRRIKSFRGREEGIVPEVEADRERVARILADAKAEGRAWLGQADALEVLDAYGIPVAPFMCVRSVEAAIAAAEDIGYPVVLKADAEGLVHKTESGAVRLDLADPEEVHAAWQAAQGSLAAAGHEMDGAVVMRQVEKRREVLLGFTNDKKFGPVLVFGLGGVYAEVLRDVTFRVAPLSDAEAVRMVEGIRALPILTGARGDPPADRAILADALVRLSALAMDNPDILELDVNPFLVGVEGEGGLAVDARIRIA